VSRKHATVYRDGKSVRDSNGKYVKEHRLVYEQYHSCYLLPWCAIRHLNGIKTDNRPQNLEPWSRRGRAANFGKWAEPIPEDRRCMKCGSFETKIDDDGRHQKEHWAKGHGDYAGGYLCYFCNGEIYRREHPEPHRRVYENHYKCCLLPKTEVRFKNGDKTDIRIENLEVLWRGQSCSLGRRIPKDRRCMTCRGFEAHGDWTKRPGGYICNSCRATAVREELREDRRDRRIHKLEQRMQSDPDFTKPKRCAVCHSTTTYKRDGVPEWYRSGDAGEVQCNRCYNKQNRRPSETAGLLRAWQKVLKASLMFPKNVGEQGKRPRRNALRAAKRRVLNESMRRYAPKTLEAPKRCAECGSTTTSKNVKGKDNWYRLEVPIGPIGYLDNNCYRKRCRRINNQRPGVRER
jgi:hypothetical protein